MENIYDEEEKSDTGEQTDNFDDITLDESQPVKEEIQPDVEDKPEKEPKKKGRKKKEGSSVPNNCLDFTSFLKNETDIIPEEKEKQIIPTGIDLLDAILGGGFASGSMQVVTGLPGTGKSMLGMQFIANAQKKYPGMISVFLDSEQSVTTQRLANLGVLNPKIKPYTEFMLEDVFRIIESLCLYKEKNKMVEVPSIVVWDSVANTLCRKEVEVTDPNSALGLKPRMLSYFISKYITKLTQYNISLFVVNQLRDVINLNPYQKEQKNLSFMRGEKDMPGGNSLKFNAFHLLQIRFKKGADESDGFVGYVAGLKCVKNKLFSPNIEIDVAGSFINGFNNFYTNYLFLSSHKRLIRGTTSYLIKAPDIKFRTRNAEEVYQTNPKFREIFDEVVKETIQQEIIEKHTVDVSDEDEDQPSQIEEFDPNV